MVSDIIYVTTPDWKRRNDSVPIGSSFQNHLNVYILERREDCHTGIIWLGRSNAISKPLPNACNPLTVIKCRRNKVLKIFKLFPIGPSKINPSINKILKVICRAPRNDFAA